MKFEDCVNEIGDVCLFCDRSNTDDNFDSDNDICRFDDIKESDRYCKCFICSEQCASCDPACSKLQIEEIEEEYE